MPPISSAYTSPRVRTAKYESDTSVDAPSDKGKSSDGVKPSESEKPSRAKGKKKDKTPNGRPFTDPNFKPPGRPFQNEGGFKPPGRPFAAMDDAPDSPKTPDQPKAPEQLQLSAI